MPIPRVLQPLGYWGATRSERVATSPADLVVTAPDVHWVRAIDIQAPAGLVWRWVCQLRASPYSYDWVDNYGRPSPTHLVDGLDALACGQSMLHIFKIVDFETGKYVTIMPRTGRHLLPYARSYVIVPRGTSRSRLIVHIRARSPQRHLRLAGGIALGLLSIVDRVLSRKELLNLKRLAERDSRAIAIPHRRQR